MEQVLFQSRSRRLRQAKQNNHYLPLTRRTGVPAVEVEVAVVVEVVVDDVHSQMNNHTRQLRFLVMMVVSTGVTVVEVEVDRLQDDVPYRRQTAR